MSVSFTRTTFPRGGCLTKDISLSFAEPFLKRRSSSKISSYRQLPILKPILDVCGNSVVNLSVLCPQMSAVSTDAVEDDQRLAFACSLASLQTVKFAVPVESDDPTNHAGLEKLSRLLITPITKPGVRYSLFLVRCPVHNAVGFRVADTSIAGLQRHIGILVGTNPPMEECQDCWKRNNTVGQEDRSGTGYGHLMPAAASPFTLARSKLLQYSNKLESHSLHRWTLLKNSIVRSHPVDPAPPEADADVQHHDVYRRHDDDEARDEEGEEDTFMFPEPHPLGSHSADGGPPSENHWLDSLLEDLGDDNNNYASDVESPRGPSSLPVDDDDGPYPPIHPLLLPSGLQSHSVVHDPLPEFDADDDDDDDRFCVPDAIEDTSDDESDALLTPYSEPTSLPGGGVLSFAFGGDEFA
ncbi:hypothetical protein LXA43DRAFT_705828 [Ganoderma leucocontextum]|nr:hypothetical protein LXA43DRAFT_705828 [Ganoderma leucocontextum]